MSDGPYNRTLGLIRIVLVYCFVAALVWTSKPTPALVAAGAVFVVLGESFRIWAAGHLLKSKELAVSGPYRYTQNPLYFGRLSILTGFCLMARLPYHANLGVLATGWAVFFLYYLPRKIRVEGARLKLLHGEAWESYFQSVPVIFPRLRPYGVNIRGWDMSRFKRNREHWMIVGVLAVSVFFLVRAISS